VILGAAVLHKLIFREAGASWWVILALAALAGVAFALDWLATVYGARKLGATWRGMVGAVAGALVGLFFGPLGLVAGPFLGAVLLEMTGGRALGESGRAGIGAVLGILVGTVGKLACCIAMVGLFVLDVMGTF
jgi:hypothetical protein